jgi:hypothetical protein
MEVGLLEVVGSAVVQELGRGEVQEVSSVEVVKVEAKVVAVMAVVVLVAQTVEGVRVRVAVGVKEVMEEAACTVWEVETWG